MIDDKTGLESGILLVAAERLSASIDKNVVESGRELTVLMERTVGLFRDFDLATNLSPEQYESTAIAMNELLDKIAGSIAEMTLNEFDILTAVDCIPEALPRLYMTCLAIDLLFKRSQVIDWKKCFIGGPNEIVRDFQEHCNAIRYPLKGIFLRSYAIQTLFPHLLNREVINEDVAADFLVESFGEMHKLWVRLGFQGPLSDLETRQHSRREMVSHILFPIRKLAELFSAKKLAAKHYAEEVCPALLEHIVSSADYYSQTLVFAGLLQEIPASLHRETLTTLLEAVSCFSYKISLKDTLKQLIDRIAEEQHEPMSMKEELYRFDLLWAKVSHILAGKLIKLDRDSELVSVAAPLIHSLLKLGVNTETVKRLDAILAFLNEHLSDCQSSDYAALMTEIVMECDEPAMLLKSPAALQLIGSFDLLSKFLHRLAECKSIEEDDTGVLVNVLAAVHYKDYLDVHLPAFDDMLQTTKTIISKLSPSRALNTMINLNSPDNFLVNCCLQQVILAHSLESRQDIITAIEKEAGRKSESLLTAKADDHPEYLSADARAFQACTALILSTHEAMDAKQEPLCYLFLTKAIQTIDQHISTNALIAYSFTSLLVAFKDASNSLLRKADVEALIANLLRVTKRQLDPTIKTTAAIGLLQIACQFSVSIDILKELVEVLVHSINLITCQADKSRLGLRFFYLALLAFTNYPDIVVLYKEVNDFLWSLREKVVASNLAEYNQLWNQWLSVLPPSIIEPSALEKEASPLLSSSSSSSLVPQHEQDPEEEEESEDPVVRAMHSISLTDEFQ